MCDERIVVRRPVGPPPFALRVAAVLVVPLLLYALVATGQKAIDKYRLNQEAERLRAEVVSLRAENIQLWMQRYAERLEHYSRLAPYNWFNFYPFWD